MNNKFASKSVLCVLSFIALSAAAGSAFSQSREYRRGYDQGYRDGAEAQSNQQQDGRRGRITIDEAIYGERQGTCDARPAVENAAGGRRQMSIRADNNLCGDPSPDRRKALTVTYRCGDSAPQRITAQENATMNISCR